MFAHTPCPGLHRSTAWGDGSQGWEPTGERRLSEDLPPVYGVDTSAVECGATLGEGRPGSAVPDTTPTWTTPRVPPEVGGRSFFGQESTCLNSFIKTVVGLLRTTVSGRAGCNFDIGPVEDLTWDLPPRTIRDGPVDRVSSVFWYLHTIQ